MNTSNRPESPEQKQKTRKRSITKETAESSSNKIKFDSSADISQFKTQEVSSPTMDKKKYTLKDQIDPKKTKSKKDLNRSPTARKDKSKSNNDIQLNASKRTVRKKVKYTEPFTVVVEIESFKRYNLGMSYNEGEPEETTRCKCVIF